jgi:hypothetical protein
VTGKCCAEAASCSGNADSGLIIDCISTNDCTTSACVTQCENAHPGGKASEQAFFGCLGAKCSTACQ